MNLKFYPYTIKLKEDFTISVNSRKSTSAVMVEINLEDLTGYGEASLPPYLKENQQSVTNFLRKIDLSSFKDITDLNLVLDYIESIDIGNYAAKAAVDIALHDLMGKIKNVPVYTFLNIEKGNEIYTSITIGISDEATIQRKIAEVKDYKYLKIKLGGGNDKKSIEIINSLADKPIFVDVNQGWEDEYFALDMINWLSEKNVILVEQPLPKEKIKEMRWLIERSPLPIIADEAVQSSFDLKNNYDLYSGVNIKLMKAGGIRSALRLMNEAKKFDMKIMLGCMTETSCAISAASHIASLADWVDLDGAELISNDLFSGVKIDKGKVIIPELPGIGIKKL